MDEIWDEMWCEHGSPRGGHCSACNKKLDANHRYVSTMPLDGSRSIVHLKADDERARFRFISVERLKWVENGGFPVKGRTDIIVIPLNFLKEGEGVTENHVKYELSKLHGCSPDDITVSVSRGVYGVRGVTPNSSLYGRADGKSEGTIGTHHGSRRKKRYSHGLDPDMPPPGWVPR